MQTQTRTETSTASLNIAIASRASTLVAIGDVTRSTVISRTDNPLLPHQHAPDLPPHTVAPPRGQIGQLHKVLVPRRSQPRRIEQIKRIERGPQLLNRGRRVQNPDLRSGGQGREARTRIVQLLVIPDDKVFQRRGFLVVLSTAVAEALPPNTDRGVDADEDEVRSLEQRLQGFIVPDRGDDKVLLPLLADVVV